MNLNHGYTGVLSEPDGIKNYWQRKKKMGKKESQNMTERAGRFKLRGAAAAKVV